MSRDTIFTSDELFLTEWTINRDVVVVELAKHYGLPPKIVDRASSRDARTLEQALRRNVIARAESLRVRINNRFVVMVKNKEALLATLSMNSELRNVITSTLAAGLDPRLFPRESLASNMPQEPRWIHPS